MFRRVSSYEEQKQFSKACETGDLETVERLIDHPDIDIHGIECDTPLTNALGGHHREIAELLIAKGADLNIRGVGGKTALHWAISEGFLDLVDLFIELKVDLEKFSMVYHRTPLIEAMFKGNDLGIGEKVNLSIEKRVAIILKLIGAGAVVTVRAFDCLLNMIDESLLKQDIDFVNLILLFGVCHQFEDILADRVFYHKLYLKLTTLAEQYKFLGSEFLLSCKRLENQVPAVCCQRIENYFSKISGCFSTNFSQSEIELISSNENLNCNAMISFLNVQAIYLHRQKQLELKVAAQFKSSAESTPDVGRSKKQKLQEIVQSRSLAESSAQPMLGNRQDASVNISSSQHSFFRNAMKGAALVVAASVCVAGVKKYIRK